ncbi:MAG: hypothetical protein KA715_09890 [Xanthomonadaceae bacterium]|nr:hypothetical protein [Xanthomonadaceae bacterium]
MNSYVVTNEVKQKIIDALKKFTSAERASGVFTVSGCASPDHPSNASKDKTLSENRAKAIAEIMGKENFKNVTSHGFGQTTQFSTPSALKEYQDLLAKSPITKKELDVLKAKKEAVLSPNRIVVITLQ